MELIRSWVLAICAVSVLSATVQALTPKNALHGSVKMICALLLISAMVSPLKKLDISDFRIAGKKAEYSITDKTERLQLENEKIRQEIIEESISAYILNRAKQFGDNITASVRCKDGIPESVVLRAENGKISQKTLEMIEKECGIKKVTYAEG